MQTNSLKKKVLFRKANVVINYEMRKSLKLIICAVGYKTLKLLTLYIEYQLVFDGRARDANIFGDALNQSSPVMLFQSQRDSARCLLFTCNKSFRNFNDFANIDNFKIFFVVWKLKFLKIKMTLNSLKKIHLIKVLYFYVCNSF